MSEEHLVPYIVGLVVGSFLGITIYRLIMMVFMK